jgi:nucleoside-diphosphate-sugar epimerase
LVDFLSLCVHHPNAVNQTFFVSDGQDVSTLELIRAIAASANGTSRIFFVPVSWLLWIARLMGRESTIQRLCGNLQIDISKARNLLEWSPRFTLEEELKLVMEKQVQYV